MSKQPKITSTRPYNVIYGDAGETHRKAYEHEQHALDFMERHKGVYSLFGLYNFNAQSFVSEYISDQADRHLAEEYVEQHFPKESPTEVKKRLTRHHILLVIKYYLRQYGYVGAVIVASALIRHWFPPFINPQLSIGLAALCYSGGTLGFLIAWRVQTWGGISKPEQINVGLLVGSYLLGTFFTIMSIT